MLGQDIRRIVLSWDMLESGDTRSDRLPCAVVREGIVAFVHPRMRDRRCVDTRLIIPKHHASTLYWHTEIAKGVPEVDHLLRTSASSHIFASKCSCLHRRLQLAVPIDGRLVHEVKNTRD